MSEKQTDENEVSELPENEEKWFAGNVLSFILKTRDTLYKKLTEQYESINAPENKEKWKAYIFFLIGSLGWVILAGLAFILKAWNFLFKNPVKFHESIPSLEIKIAWFRNKLFWIGFLGWFIFNGLAWVLAGGLAGSTNPSFGLVVLLANIGSMIYFAFTNRMIANGLAAAFGVALILVMVGFVLFLVACFSGNLW